MVFKPLAAIRATDDPETIQIRVIKKWIPHNQNTDFCYLFVDEHADAIHATCLLEDEAYFDNFITVGKCYIVDSHIPMPQQTYMPACAHEASLCIGKKTTFRQVENDKIPFYCYHFASYMELSARASSRMLTDYIGLVDDRGMKPITGGQRLRKVMVKDESGNVIELTFWPRQQHLVPRTIARGDIWALTGVVVTTYFTDIQLESTPATTIEVNPQKPETAPHVERLRQMPASAIALPRQITPVTVVKNKTAEDLAIRNRFTCLASIESIKQDRPWFYVICSICGRKMMKKEGRKGVYICRNDDGEPNFHYCVNANIKDNTNDLDVVFFNEAMTQMLGITCHDMITQHGEDDAYQIPADFLKAGKKPKFMTLTMKPDQSVSINSVEVADEGQETASTAPTKETSAMSSNAPITPAKRQWRANKVKEP